MFNHRGNTSPNCVQQQRQPSFVPACKASIFPIPNLKNLMSSVAPCSSPCCTISPSFACNPCSPCGPYIPCAIKYYPYATSRIICMSTCPPCTTSTYRC